MPMTPLQRTALAAAIAACFPGASQAAGVARVDFATGNVTALGADGRSRPLAKGAEIEVGETIATQQGRAQLRFADGAYMSLQPQTEFKVEEFKFAGKADGSENIVMNLLKGGMRTITGLIGRTNRNAYRLKTDVATIGIRGTEYTVRYTNSIEVFVSDGAISVDNQSGSFVVPGGTGVMVSNQNTPPQQTDQKPVLPPESPAQQEQEEVTQRTTDPVNPIQESQPPAPLLTGTFGGSFAWGSFAAGGGIGSSPEITLDGSGTLTEFLDTSEGAVLQKVTTATRIRDGNDGIVAWGRWVDGQMTSNGSPVTLTEPLLYIVGLPATNIPMTGPGFYTMVGGVATCVGSGCTTATILQGSTISLNFGTGAANLAMQINLNGSVGGTYTFAQTSGGLSGGTLGFGGTLTGGSASSSGVGVQGFVAGDGAPRIGLHVTGYVYNASFTNFTNFQGVAAYAKQ